MSRRCSLIASTIIGAVASASGFAGLSTQDNSVAALRGAVQVCCNWCVQGTFFRGCNECVPNGAGSARCTTSGALYECQGVPYATCNYDCMEQVECGGFFQIWLNNTTCTGLPLPNPDACVREYTAGIEVMLGFGSCTYGCL